MVKLLKWRFAREKAFKILDNWKEDAFVDKLKSWLLKNLECSVWRAQSMILFCGWYLPYLGWFDFAIQNVGIAKAGADWLL